MKYKILSAEEVEGQFRVRVETDYGIDDIGLSLDSMKADIVTGQPKWLFEVEAKLKKKYSGAEVPVKDFSEFIGTEREL